MHTLLSRTHVPCNCVGKQGKEVKEWPLAQVHHIPSRTFQGCPNQSLHCSQCLLQMKSGVQSSEKATNKQTEQQPQKRSKFGHLAYQLPERPRRICGSMSYIRGAGRPRHQTLSLCQWPDVECSTQQSSFSLPGRHTSDKP